MSSNRIIKEYNNEDLIVLWEPKKCIHAAICVETLPKVYDPDRKPWIKPENASIQELKDQIHKCPSGALSYRQGNHENKEINENNNMETKVDVMENGPLLVQGTLHIKNSKGEVEIKTKTTAFCRCGASANKPYCDGVHKKINFIG
jgi:uncharacterized Fe-S cluster protein YjdI